MNIEGRQVLRHERAGDVASQLGDMVTRAASEFAIPLGVAAAYYLGCLMGFALRFPSSGISFFWPPNAILITALLIAAPVRWPLLLATTFVAHAIAHTHDGIAISALSIQFFGNASQALLAAWAIRHFGSVAIFADLRRVLVFVVGACLFASAAASIVPSFVYVHLGWAPDFFDAWRARAVSNTVATLTLVPSLLILCRSLQLKPVVQPRRVAEFGALLIGLFAVERAAVYTGRADLLALSITLYAMTPVLLWATVRFGGAGLSFALSATVLLISNAAARMSPLAGGVGADAIVGVQLLLTANAVPLMLLAGLLEQNRSEHRALVDMEHETRAMLRALPDKVFLHTVDGVVLRSSPDPINDMSTTTVVRARAVPPMVTSDERALTFTDAGDTLRVIEYTETTDGVNRRYEARSVAVDEGRVLTVIRDITKRWRSEQALRETQHRYALATGVGLIGVWELDVQAGTLHVEGSLRASLGYSAEEIRDTLSDWEPLIFDADRDEVMGRLSALIEGTARAFEAEFRLIHRDGSLRWLNSKGGVTDMVDRKPTRIVGTYVDVTEQKEATRALRQANDRLVRLGRTAVIGEVTASIAHELSQPLSAITTNVLACLRGADGDLAAQVREVLSDVLHDSRRASQILERTQRLFRNEPAQPSSSNLNDVVREVLKIATPRLHELDVRVTLVLDQNLPAVYADVVQIQQVLFNLIMNGADAMHAVVPQMRHMRITTRHGTRHVVVSVRDSGTGLNRADTSRVFEPFYTTKSGGSGMGLAISRSIVQSHGGSLWAASNQDRGTTFRFKIPVPSASRATGEFTPGQRILVVDDHGGLRKSLTRLLRSWGHFVAVASSGTRAVAVAQTFQPDAAVIDVSLGDMSGIELARRLRALSDERLYLIALTAYDSEQVRRECMAAGFEAYLVKPQHIPQLETLLTRVH
jgi:PAS domain S-box-containing protein